MLSMENIYSTNMVKAIFFESLLHITDKTTVFYQISLSHE